MKRMLSLALVGFAAVGCTLPPAGIKPNDVYDNVGAEIRRATQQRPAPVESDAVSQALVPPLTVEMPQKAMGAIEMRFDLAVTNAPADQVFRTLASDTRYSMLVHPSVKEAISIYLKDVTIMEALEAIRELYGYEYRVQGTRIYIQPITLQTRVFQVNYLMGRRSGSAELRVQSASIGRAGPTAGASGASGAATTTGTAPGTPGAGGAVAGQATSSQVQTTSDNDFWRDIGESLRAIVGTEGGRSVVINQQAGVIVVRAMPMEFRAVEQLLKTLSIVVERQVMLEAKIIEVSLNQEFQAGVNWGMFNNSNFAAGVMRPGTTLRTDGSLATPVAANAAGFTANTRRQGQVSPDPLNPGVTGSVGTLGPLLSAAAGAPGAIVGLAFQTGNFAAMLDFLQTQGTLNVLSSPRIATLNNQKAVLKVGTDEYFITNVSTSTTTSTTGNVTTPSITTQPFFSGIALDVTPQIDENDQIILHIHPSVSKVSDKPKTVDLGQAGTFTMPLASSNINESDTIVRVRDGNIVAIGGLMKQEQEDSRSGVPGASGGSVLGWPFRNEGRRLQKSELVILIKPTVIKGEQAWQKQANEVGERIETLRPMQTPPQQGSRR